MKNPTIDPAADKRAWAFRVEPTADIMVGRVVEDIAVTAQAASSPSAASSVSAKRGPMREPPPIIGRTVA